MTNAYVQGMRVLECALPEERHHLRAGACGPDAEQECLYVVNLHPIFSLSRRSAARVLLRFFQASLGALTLPPGVPNVPLHRHQMLRS